MSAMNKTDRYSQVRAEFYLEVPLYSPGKSASRISVPTMIKTNAPRFANVYV